MKAYLFTEDPVGTKLQRGLDGPFLRFYSGFRARDAALLRAGRVMALRTYRRIAAGLRAAGACE